MADVRKNYRMFSFVDMSSKGWMKAIGVMDNDMGTSDGSLTDLF